jgi:predicted Zn-dependent protease
MTSTGICIALAVILAPCFAGQAKEPAIDSANQFFQAGAFAEAGKIYARMVAQNPRDYPATLGLGRIALLSNRLDDAQKWLEQAIALQPGVTDAKVMLAEVFYRRDNLQKAAASLNGVEVSSDKLVASQYPTLNVAQLESFKGQIPYDVQGNGTLVRV